MVTSAHVARRLPEDGIPVATLEPKTSSLFGPRAIVSVKGGAIALAQALSSSPFHVRYPASDLVEPAAFEALLPRRLDVAVVYQTVRPVDLDAQLQAALSAHYALYLASPSAATNVLSCVLPPPERVVTFGATTRDRYEALKPRHFPAAQLVSDDSWLPPSSPS